MKRESYLFEAGGLLSMGQASERAFGKRNFLELYAVFSSPVLYRVTNESKRELGSLEQAFVDRLVEDMSAFLLGGHAWLVVSVDHRERMIRVKPAPRGKKPSWGGFVPQFLGRDLCQEMRAVLTSEEDYPFLDTRAKGALANGAGAATPCSSMPGPLPGGHSRRADQPDAQVRDRVGGALEGRPR
jgi:ATP-dependent Lhr-like helicase